MTIQNISTFNIDGSLDASFETPSIQLPKGKGFIFGLELVSPVDWPRQQFVLVQTRYSEGPTEYLLNPVRKIYFDGAPEIFSVVSPEDLFDNDPNISFLISPRYYGPSGGREGTTTLSLFYFDKPELDVIAAI